MTHEHLAIALAGCTPQGTIMATREELIKVFLTPRWLPLYGGKEFGYEWRLRFPDGVIAAVHGRQPNPQPTRVPQNWTITGANHQAVAYVHEAFRIRMAQLRAA